MTICDSCEATREAPMHPFFDLKCLYCGARLIQRIQGLKKWRPPSEIKQRCRKVLDDWTAYGHPETTIRQLAAASSPPLCEQPGRGQRSASAGQARTKHPSARASGPTPGGRSAGE